MCIQTIYCTMKVHDWIGTKKEPDNPTDNNIQYGLGCLVHQLIILTEKMRKLLENTKELSEDKCRIDLEKFDESTLGKQIDILNNNYKDFDITIVKLESIRDGRNYFVHKTDSDFSKNDVKVLSETINLTVTMIHQLNNAQQKTNKNLKKKQKAKSSNQRTMMVKVIRSCPHENLPITVCGIACRNADVVLLSNIGMMLKKKGIKYKKLGKELRMMGWETHTIHGTKTPCVCRDDIQ